MAKIDKIDSSRILKDFVQSPFLTFIDLFLYLGFINETFWKFVCICSKTKWFRPMIVRPEELVDISSERFKEVLIESVKDKMLLE